VCARSSCVDHELAAEYVTPDRRESFLRTQADVGQQRHERPVDLGVEPGGDLSQKRSPADVFAQSIGSHTSRSASYVYRPPLRHRTALATYSPRERANARA
jgi:hypothetical protein